MVHTSLLNRHSSRRKFLKQSTVLSGGLLVSSVVNALAFTNGKKPGHILLRFGWQTENID